MNRDKTYGNDQRTSPIRNHRPIKGDESHSQTRNIAEERIDDDVVWGDPTRPVEPRQGCEDIAGEPVPDETGNGGDSEETLAGHMFLVPLGVGLVQGVEQCRVDESPGPDHARWPHEEFSKQASKGISHDLGGEADH